MWILTTCTVVKENIAIVRPVNVIRDLDCDLDIILISEGAYIKEVLIKIGGKNKHHLIFLLSPGEKKILKFWQKKNIMHYKIFFVYY